ncbi:class I SAM-dependent methyltransferase [Microbacterium pseudoresistens]|uniref:SAM-dependent methyltransferase n=1 Tax=Microbacterium pseudoresistens TaxID=640634 RepID=A0A7Y9EWJ8_9MICO|nr:class I SAM-dependent methyltransferase [Microbacterium pseudoresistens]NYD55257.1 SAM-dependent methyltransferase [Microbacterium pseudoresistens]
MADQTLAQSFQKAGDDYDRFRPGFPEAAADEVLPTAVTAALDLGAGTGKFTERLISRASRVIAVEPSEQMLAVLRAKLPDVEAHRGTAERIPVPDGSVDAVTVAQAFHWFDRDAACAEIRRVLVSGGTLGLLWNHSDPGCAWDRACTRVAHPGLTDGLTAEDSVTAALPGFHEVRFVQVPWRERISRADYIRRWLTVSSFLAASVDERADMVAEVERILDEDHETAGQAEFDLPQLTDVYVYRAS